MIEQANGASIEAQMHKQVQLFKELVIQNLEDRQNYDSDVFKIRSVYYSGGFSAAYYKEYETGIEYFSIEEPGNEIDFEFSAEGDRGVRRTMGKLYPMSVYIKTLDHDDLGVDLATTSRLLTPEELNDLITFMKKPRDYRTEGPPKTLVGVSPEEGAFLEEHGFNTCNLPRAAA